MKSSEENRDNLNQPSYPLAAWFLGPRAENAQVWDELINYIFHDYIHWRRNYFPSDPVVVSRVRRRSDSYEAWIDNLETTLDLILNDLKRHFPFHSPRYIAHMLSEQTLPSFLGYFAGMLFNPNNVTEEAAPITVKLELEVGKMIAEMLGYNPKNSWAHICSGGTIANLEALWVARSAQFIPFIVREFSQKQNIPFAIKTANGTSHLIQDIGDRELIALRPNENLFMLRKLAKFIHEQTRRPYEDILEEINSHISNSHFNPAKAGLYAVLENLKLSPVIFVSAAAHYSFVKAANVLGYGEKTVRLVPVTSGFKVDINKLQNMIQSLKENEYIAAVIGIAGTTEEGAVDPIHEIRFLRDKYEENQNRSFWFHVDAAWGGYVRSLFCGLNLPRLPRGSTLEQICDQYVRELKIYEKFSLEVGKNKTPRHMEIRWANKDNYASFLAMPDADSITVDPHKMGFVPYPSGIIAFKNGLVTELIQQRAQYISDDSGGVKSIDKPIEINAIGPFILEGSKPGATALSCWLAHKTIPLEAHAHGKIIRTTILNAHKLFKYLSNHRHLFNELHYEVTQEAECIHPFTFIPLFEPDTNIVCFIARPMVWHEKGLVQNDVSLKWINALNRKIYAATSIASVANSETISSAQPYFVSRTIFEEKQYSSVSIASVLRRIGVTEQEYKKIGLFILRSAVMNPWHFHAEQAGMNYLFGFMKHLHKVATVAMEEVVHEMESSKKHAG